MHPFDLTGIHVIQHNNFMPKLSSRAHHYTTLLVWDGNTGTGTSSYAGYGRDYRIIINGKPKIDGSADAEFRGDSSRHNPEDLFLASLSSCHLLSYLALCARQRVRVIAYEDDASGTMVTNIDGGKFTEVILRPRVTIAAGDDAALAMRLHDAAHKECYIASSCNFPVTHEARIVEA